MSDNDGGVMHLGGRVGYNMLHQICLFKLNKCN